MTEHRFTIKNFFGEIYCSPIGADINKDDLKFSDNSVTFTNWEKTRKFKVTLEELVLEETS